jgi:sodium-dependent dicarboxylate transporter 2/3/5
VSQTSEAGTRVLEGSHDGGVDGPPAEGGGAGPAGRKLGLVLGPAIAIGLQLIGAPEGLSAAAWWVVSIMALMLVWWVSEAVPIAATALVPLVALPLTGSATAAEAARPYADPILFLFIGGFMLAAAIERWGLHARIALTVAGALGGRPAALVAGFILSAGLLSLWISNTATALMLTPIAVAVAGAMADNGHRDPRLGVALVLGVAYAASIGGMGTPVGSPTNVIAMGFLNERGVDLSFVQWMMLSVPVVVVMLPVLWFIVARGLRPASTEDAARGRDVLQNARIALGPATPAEKRVLMVFAAVAVAWMLRELVLVKLPGLERLSDMGIAIAGALALFVLPSGDRQRPRLLDWSSAERIPWGIVILFGGGLSLAAAMDSTGLSAWLGVAMQGLQGLEPLIILVALILITLIATEMMSNVATLTAMLPIVAALAAALGINPLLLVFPVTLTASLGFMLPIATAANAIAFATGLPSLRTMLWKGFWLNVAGVAAILVVNGLLAETVLGHPAA